PPAIETAPTADPVEIPIHIGPESTAETNPAHDPRFSAPSLDSAQMHIELEMPAPPPTRSAGPGPQGTTAAAAPDEPAPGEEEGPRCLAHDLAEPCTACAERDAPVPGRLMQGALRKQPAVRLAIGIVLGLPLGWIASSPYAHRMERRVSEARTAANADR